LPVATPKPSRKAVAAISRSSKEILNPRSACSPLNVAGKLGRLNRHRMHENIADEFIDESLPPLSPFFQLGALDTMRQLHDSDNRKTDLDLSISSPAGFEYLPNGAAFTLSGDNYVRVEDQSHKAGVRGLRFWTISSMSAAKSGSNVGAWPVSSS
jgi:hypothetical protein